MTRDCDAVVEDEDLQQELELMEAMYNPEEVSIDRSPEAPGICAAVTLNVCLEKALVKLGIDLPQGFPVLEDASAKIRVLSSRGLVDSQESDLVRALDKHAKEFWNDAMRHSLVDLVLKAKEVVEELNETGGTCAICLGLLVEGQEAWFRASCWHIFHETCFAAWWKQVDERRNAEGTKSAEESTQRQQSLRAVQGRLDVRQAAINSKKERIVSLSEEMALCEGSEDPLVVREATKIAEIISRIEEEIVVDKQKEEKLKADLESTRSLVNAKDAADAKQGIECPMCKNDILYGEVEQFLPNALSALDPTLDSLVPASWVGQTTLDPSESFKAKLTDEELSAMNKAREMREKLFEAQRCKGSHVNPSEEQDVIRLDSGAPEETLNS
eukprot:CAMPEP_0184527264 /NCGR_PEP_ID=MMETSP0198_2-20121128/11101_1 /TAXON_ID=1112570 /ORGANISM="Thraustochytrium sp., Strain LLF1b" /LENGTH=384 /DNA_ID=CAMNT_0026918903 /DNA_START=84 /DNA_END=1238 /DNA_ORIENTATION=+